MIYSISRPFLETPPFPLRFLGFTWTSKIRQEISIILMASKNRLVQYHQWDEMKHPSQMIIFHSIVLKDIELLSLRNQTYLELPSEEVSLRIFKGGKLQKTSLHPKPSPFLSSMHNRGSFHLGPLWQRRSLHKASRVGSWWCFRYGWKIQHRFKSCGVPKFLEKFPMCSSDRSWHRITTWPSKCSSTSSIKPELTTWTTHPSR